MENLKADEALAAKTELRQIKYLNNVIEQETETSSGFWLVMDFKLFNSARRTLSGIEAMNMIRKGQVNGIDKGDSVSGVKFIEAIFGISA